MASNWSFTAGSPHEMPDRVMPPGSERPSGRVLRVERDGLELWCDVHGADADPTVVLLMGAACQAIQWEGPFVEPIVGAGYRVIRLDYRDIGRSSWVDFKSAPYRFDDLVDDVRAVLSATSSERWHLVGYSMGGCVAQLLALAETDQTVSLSLLSSGFASQVEVRSSPRRTELFEYLAQPGTQGQAEQVERLLGQWRLLSGRETAFDEMVWRARVESWVTRGQNPRCPHIRLGPQVFGIDRSDQLARLVVPTLILHGDDDPMFPLEHGQRLAETLPAASLSVLPGRGHDLFLDPTSTIVPAVLQHLGAATRSSS